MYTAVISSILIAILFTFILSFAFRRTGPGPINGLLFIFFIIFLFSWAIGGWIEPIKPYQVDYPWISYFFIGLFIMLLLGALLPPTPSSKNTTTKTKGDDEIKTSQVIGITIGLFFWVMFFILIIAGIARWI